MNEGEGKGTNVVDGDVVKESLVSEASKDDHLGFAHHHRCVPTAASTNMNISDG